MTAQDTLQFRGQLSAWGAASTGGDLPLWLGGRSISQANYEVHAGRNLMLELIAKVTDVACYQQKL